MKKLIFLSLLGAIGILPYRAAAQVSLSINIGSQPLWGPVGYDYVDYYYMPDIECYYNVPRRQFVYLSGSRWIFSSSLPSRYRHYDLYSGYKVVVNGRDPYRNFYNDRARYGRYRNVRTQTVIRHSNDSRYYVVKGHPGYGHRGSVRHEVRDHRRDDYRNGGRGRGNDWGRGGDRGRDHDRGHDRGRDRGNDRGRDHGRGRH